MEILFSYNGCFGVVRRCENRYSNFFEAAFVNESLGSKIQAFSIKRDKRRTTRQWKSQLPKRITKSCVCPIVPIPGIQMPASLFACFRHVEGLYFAMGLHYGRPWWYIFVRIVARSMRLSLLRNN